MPPLPPWRSWHVIHSSTDGSSVDARFDLVEGKLDQVLVLLRPR